ncbi:MAG: mechanosensitive ion channel family protein [Bacteroidota bacterium]
MDVTTYISNMRMIFQGQSQIVYTFVVLGLAVGLTYVTNRVYRRLHTRKAAPMYNFFVRAFLRAIYWPLLLLIWIQAVSINISVLLPQLDQATLLFMDKLRKASLIALLAWLVIRFIKLLEDQLLEGRLAQGNADKTTIQATGKLLRLAAFSIVTLLILPLLGIDVTGIVAFASGSAIAVGIATQHIIANYFGGIVIYFDSHFKVGDWIYLPDKNLEGTVEYIGWRSTQIRTFDTKVLYVPNAVFSSVVVVNASRMSNRKIKETINLRYADAHAVDKILQSVNQALQAHPDLDKSRAMLAYIEGFGPASLKINIHAFTNATDWKTYCHVQQDVFLKIISIIEECGGQMALLPGYIQS